MDIVLLHGRLDPQWDQNNKAHMDVLSEAKEEVVRAPGHQLPFG